MLKVLCILLVAVLFSLSTANSEEIYNVNENILQVEGFGNEEVKESNLITKCYDEETKTAYKVDSIWYPEGKCEKRICSRKNNSKTPIIKTMECEPCTDCKLPNKMCQPFKPEKNYPKCCPQCLTKATLMKKADNSKKYKYT